MAKLHLVDDREFRNRDSGKVLVVKVAVFFDVTYDEMNKLLNAVSPMFTFVGCVIDDLTMGCPDAGRYFYTRMLGEGYMVELASLDTEYAQYAETILGVPMPEEIVME